MAAVFAGKLLASSENCGPHLTSCRQRHGRKDSGRMVRNPEVGAVSHLFPSVPVIRKLSYRAYGKGTSHVADQQLKPETEDRAANFPEKDFSGPISRVRDGSAIPVALRVSLIYKYPHGLAEPPCVAPPARVLCPSAGRTGAMH